MFVMIVIYYIFGAERAFCELLDSWQFGCFFG